MSDPSNAASARRARRPARRGFHSAGLAALLCAAGCVDVPDESPMGGAPMEDAESPDVDRADGGFTDGFRPDDGPMVDRDDPDAPDRDAGPDDPDEVHIGGRPDDAGPGPVEDPAERYAAGPDPVRCPGGGALLPGLERCVMLEPLPELAHGLASATAAALPDGRVMVAGGRGFADEQPVAATWVLEGDDWRAGPDLVEPVSGAMAVGVRGRAVVVGGLGTPAAASAVQSVGFDGGAAAARQLDQPRFRGFSVHRLEGDRILVIGGETLGGGLAGVEALRPDEQRLDEVVPQLAVARRDHAAAVDARGALWVMGGVDRRDQARFAPEVLDADAAEWRSAPGPAAWATVGGAAAPTGDTILFAGGADAEGRPLSRAGIYDHAMAQWRAVGDLNTPQEYLALAPLGDEGAVLAIGPGTLEIYDPVEEGFRWLRVDETAWRAEPAVAVVDGRAVIIGGTSQGRHMARCYQVELLPAEPPADPAEMPEEEEEQRN